MKRIANGGGTLDLERVLDLSISQECSVARRSIPLSSSGEKLDSGTYILKPLELKFSTRLSDLEKVTLENIYNASATVTIILDDEVEVEEYKRWIFVGWFRSKPSVRYKKASQRPWLADLVFVIASTLCVSDSYELEYQWITNGDFETGDLTGWDYYQASVSDQYPHGGIYSVFLYEGWILQTFVSSIPKSQILSFGFWGKGQVANNYCKVYFSDSSSITVNIPQGEGWTYVDLLSSIPDGKEVSAIEFRGLSGGPSWVDDVDLIGSISP